MQTLQVCCSPSQCLQSHACVEQLLGAPLARYVETLQVITRCKFLWLADALPELK